MGFARAAVDNTAKEYWTKYFGPYGKAWTKDVPRKVKAALDAELRRDTRTAAAGPMPVEVVPVSRSSFAETPAGGLRFEGFARAGRTARLFLAEFTPDGALASITSKALPAPAAPTEGRSR